MEISSPAQRVRRLAKELELLQTEPPPGIGVWPSSESDLFHLKARKGLAARSGSGRSAVVGLVPDHALYYYPQNRRYERARGDAVR